MHHTNITSNNGHPAATAAQLHLEPPITANTACQLEKVTLNPTGVPKLPLVLLPSLMAQPKQHFNLDCYG